MNENEREMERRASISQLTHNEECYRYCIPVCKVLLAVGVVLLDGTELRTQLHTTYIQFTRTRTLPGTLED